MSVTNAEAPAPSARVAATSRAASPRARAGSRMNAPSPHFTSYTMAPAPSAIFLLTMLETMNGSNSTVAVTSRSAYNRPSAGARSRPCPTMNVPTRSSWVRIASGASVVRKPGIDSSLSSVPPVWPSPRPDTIGTITPHAATSGASGSDTLSPTPPVECLSADGRPRSLQSKRRPECSSASVSARVSSASSPRRNAAISQALTW